MAPELRRRTEKTVKEQGGEYLLSKLSGKIGVGASAPSAFLSFLSPFSSFNLIPAALFWKNGIVCEYFSCTFSQNCINIVFASEKGGRNERAASTKQPRASRVDVFAVWLSVLLNLGES